VGKRKPLAPECPGCKTVARLTSGKEIYRNREDLADKPIYVCESCGAYVGCHPGTTRPLGTPAGPELRRARSMLHDQRIDPIWRSAASFYGPSPNLPPPKPGLLQSVARNRVYGFLADRLGISAAESHTGMFDIETCRLAWRALEGVSYAEVREWAHAKKIAAVAASQMEPA
jgi:hypothetical protein